MSRHIWKLETWAPYLLDEGAVDFLSDIHKMLQGVILLVQNWFFFSFLFYFVQWPTNLQLIDKLSHSYMFRHYCVILRELVASTVPSYTSMSNAAVGNTI